MDLSRLWRHAPLLAVLSLAACGDSTSSAAKDVARIEATPATLSLLVDETKGISARAYDASGAPVSRTLFWSTSDADVATVSQAGVVTAVTAGKTDIAVSAGGKSTVVPVTVAGRPATLVRVSPPTSSIRVGQSASLTAQVLDATGAVVSGKAVTWSSSSPSVATVNDNGVVTGVGTGNATISAKSGSLTGNALVSVQSVPVASVALTPSTGALEVGEALQLVAEARDGSDAPLPGRTITWSTSAPTVASVSSTGFVIALAPGTATITATSEGKSASARLSISAVPVASVSIVPSTATVSVGQTGQLLARVLDASGAVLNGRAVTWSSSAPNVATVDNDGTVTAVSSGTARITATAEGKSGSANVTVTPIPVATIGVTPNKLALVEGDTQQLTAQMKDAQGTTLSGRVVSWVSGSPAIATVDANGLVTAVGPGSAIVIATSEGVSVNIPVSVTPASVASIVVTPASGTLVQGDAQQLSASILDSRGNGMAGKTAAWSSSNVLVATVSPTGLVRAVAPGNATIRATADGVTGTAAFTVTLAPVGSVTITPSPANVFTGKTLQLALAVKDASGALLSLAGRKVSWTSSSASVATVNSSGLVTGASQGSATITATVDGISASVSVAVTDVPVASVDVAPSTASLTVGATRQLTATAQDAQGNAITGRVTAWSSTDPSIATVSANGLVSALAPGSAQVEATIGGVKGSATITVSAVPVVSVSVSPASSSVTVGGSVQLSATPKDAQGNAIGGRTATWSSSDAAVASVDASGKVTATATGSATITATVDGVGGTATVTVTAVPVASVDVTPSSASVAEGQTTTLTATSKDAQGNTLAGRTVTWSTSDAAIATVSSAGVVTGVKAGSATITATGPAPVGGGSAPAGSATITVVLEPVASVTIAPATPTVLVGGTQQLDATLFGTNVGVALSQTGRTVTWATGDAAIATVSPTGLVTGVNAGTTTITVDASSPGQSTPATASVVLTVTAASTSRVGRVGIVPLTGTLHVGTRYARTVNAVAYDVSGGIRPTEPITWSSGDPARLSVTPAASTGTATLVATGTAPGGVRVIATAPNATPPVADTIVIVLDLVPIASVDASPSSMTLVMGTTQGALMTARDSAGNVVDRSLGDPLGGRAESWASSDSRVVTVSGTGAITAQKRGSATVEVRVAGAGPGRVAVTVTNPAGSSVVGSVVVSPSSLSLEQGSTATFGATALDANGTPMSGQRFTWTVSGSGAQLATTSPSGADVIAVDSGTVQVAASTGGRTGRATIRITLLAVDTIEAIPGRAAPSVALSDRKGKSATVKFRVLSTKGKLAGRTFTVASSNPAVVDVTIVGPPITDNAGKGEFVATLAPSAKPGDSAQVVVSAGGKRTVWALSIT